MSFSSTDNPNDNLHFHYSSIKEFFLSLCLVFDWIRIIVENMKFVIFLSIVAAICMQSLAEAHEIFLPPDATISTIIGNGFKLQVTQLNTIKDNWQSIAQESAEIKNPRKSQEDSVVDAGLYEKTKLTSGDQVVGLLDQELLAWISQRATSLVDRIDSLKDDVEESSNEQKIVAQILLLNTLIDLENLTQENIKSLKWIKIKVRSLASDRDQLAKGVEIFVKNHVEDNLKIEKKVKGTNNPGEKWMTNMKAIKRVLHEQRFSEPISAIVIDHLGSKFSMMERSRVFDIYKSDKKLDDRLWYKKAKGKVPAHFPFTAQYAIMNEA